VEGGTRRRSRGSIGTRSGRLLRIGAVATLIVGAYLIAPTLFVLDDAYIALHSARTILAGHDRIYGAAPLIGATSPPYVALLSVLTWLHLPALRVASALGLALFAWSMFALARARGVSLYRSALLPVLVLSTGYTLANAVNGLETGLAMAVAIWLLVFAVRDSIVGVSLLAGLLPLLRPDLAPCAGFVWLFVLGRHRRARDWTIAVAFSLVVVLPFLLWVRVDTGAWLPQTMSAKAAWFAEACRPWSVKLNMTRQALADVLGGEQLAPISLAALALVFTPLGRVGLLASLVTLAAYAAILPGGLFHNTYRYTYAIAVPWIVYGLAEAAATSAAPRVIDGLLALVTAFAVWAMPPVVRALHPSTTDLVETPAWVEAHTPADAVILVHDAGAISEFAMHPAVDMVGLKTPSSMAAHNRWTAPSCGIERSKAVSAIARSSHASYMIVTPAWDSIFHLRDGLTREGMPTTLIWTAPRGGYRVYRFTDR
jgi:hypothetical protein